MKRTEKWWAITYPFGSSGDLGIVAKLFLVRTDARWEKRRNRHRVGKIVEVRPTWDDGRRSGKKEPK